LALAYYTHSTTALTTIYRNDHVELHAPNVPDDGVGVVVVCNK